MVHCVILNVTIAGLAVATVEEVEARVKKALVGEFNPDCLSDIDVDCERFAGTENPSNEQMTDERTIAEKLQAAQRSAEKVLTNLNRTLGQKRAE